MPTQPASERKVRFGLIGAGRIATKAVAPAFRKATNAELYAVASRDIRRAEALTPVRAYGSYSDLIRDPDVEAVYIATHNGLHHSLTIEAARHGKHVLCEKPLANNESECGEMLRASEDAGCLLAEAFMYRHHPQIAKAKELVVAGRIGELQVVEASFRFNLTRQDDVRLDPAKGGGALLDVGCYCVNASRFFFGGEPVAVAALGHFHPTHGVDLSVQGALDFDDGRYAVISCGFDGGLHQRVSLIGTAGVLTLNVAFNTRAAPAAITVQSEEESETIAFPPVDAFQLEIENFASAIPGKSQPLLPPEDSVHNARVLDRIRQRLGV